MKFKCNFNDLVFFFILGTLLNIPFPDTSYTRPFIQGFWDGTDWILDNGTPLVYTNWETGEPQNTDTNRYIRLRKGKWRTSIDLNIRPVFCSYKLNHNLVFEHKSSVWVVEHN